LGSGKVYKILFLSSFPPPAEPKPLLPVRDVPAFPERDDLLLFELLFFDEVESALLFDADSAFSVFRNDLLLFGSTPME
jgi:hypothetical protein